MTSYKLRGLAFVLILTSCHFDYCYNMSADHTVHLNLSWCLLFPSLSSDYYNVSFLLIELESYFENVELLLIFLLINN
jgi:hypothetical protein